MKFTKAFTVLILVFILSCSVFIFSACDGSADSSAKGAVYEENFTPTKDKAMILIPGLMASALFNAETDEAIWSPKGFLNLVGEFDDNLSALDAKYEGNTYNNSDYDKEKQRLLQDLLIKYMGCDDNGVPNTTVRVANMSSENPTDAFGGMGYLYKDLYAKYREQYDVVVWQYDWRQSNVESARHLKEFIDKCGWSKVQFYTHSMGGIVVSNYLKDAANRSRVELFMPFGAPLLDSMDAVTNLFSEEALAFVKDLFKGMGMDFNLAEVARLIPSVYELLPTKEFFELYGEGDSPIFINGQPATYSQFMDSLLTQSWVKGSDGEVKDFIKNLEAYQDAFFVNASYDSKNGVWVEDSNSEQKVHVSQLVPTQYVIGVGKFTVNRSHLVGEDTVSEDYTDQDKTEIDASDSIFSNYIGVTGGQGNGKVFIRDYETGIFRGLGDGTVPAYSASCGQPLDSANCHLVYGVKHGPLLNDSVDSINGYCPAYLTGLAYIDEVVPNYVAKTDAELVLSDVNGSGRPQNVNAVSDEIKITAITVGSIMTLAAVAVVLTFILTKNKRKTKDNSAD